MKVNRTTILQWLKVIVPIGLMLFAIHEISGIIQQANGGEIKNKISAIDVRTLILIAFIPLIVAFPMFFYDYFITKKLKIKRRIRRLMKESLIINSYSNLIGFGGLVGVVLRTHYFKKSEQDNATFFKMIASVTLFYLSGISLFVWPLFIFYWDLVLFQQHKILLVATGVLGLYTPFLIVKAIVQLMKRTRTLREVMEDVVLLCVSIAEWFGAFVMLYILSKLLVIQITAVDLWPIFLIASCVGIVSMIPGGVGSFDLVFLWGAESIGVPAESILVSLLCYRISYYIIPFMAGTTLLVRDVWGKFDAGLSRIPNFLLEKLSHIVATILVFSAGLILLIASVAPGAVENFSYANDIINLPFINYSHQIAVVMGMILLTLSNGISYKDKYAYRITTIVLVFAALFFFIKGVQYNQSLFMLGIAALLFISRKRFYRESYNVTWGRSILNTFIISIVILAYIMVGVIEHANTTFALPEKLQRIVITDADDLFKSAMIGIMTILIVVIIEVWLRKKTQYKKKTALAQEICIRQHLRKYNYDEEKNWFFIRDKLIFWNEKKTVLLSYKIISDKLVVLGDLIGEQQQKQQTIEQLLNFADRYGYTPIFHEVDEGFLPNLYPFGYRFFKIGEEGIINTDKIVKQQAKEQYQISIFKAPLVPKVKQKIQALKSLDTYTSILIVEDTQQNLVAYSEINEANDEQSKVNLAHIQVIKKVDLQSLYIQIIDVCKRQGIAKINVGLTYLKRVEISKFAGINEKIAAQMIVNVQEEYTNKEEKPVQQSFVNEWKPIYTAYRKSVFLPFTMAQLMILSDDNKLATLYKQITAAKASRKKQ